MQCPTCAACSMMWFSVNVMLLWWNDVEHSCAWNAWVGSRLFQHSFKKTGRDWLKLSPHTKMVYCKLQAWLITMTCHPDYPLGHNTTHMLQVEFDFRSKWFNLGWSAISSSLVFIVIKRDKEITDQPRLKLFWPGILNMPHIYFSWLKYKKRQTFLGMLPAFASFEAISHSLK